MGKRKGEEAERAGSKIWEGKERKGNSVVQDKHYRDFFRKGSKSMASLSLNWSLKLRGFKPVSS